MCNVNKALVAVKTFENIPESMMNNERKLIEREVGMMSQLHHPHIASFYGIVDSNGNGNEFGIVMEFVNGGSLFDLLNDKTKQISREQSIRMGCEITSAVAYLHKRGILHRDLKSLNVMLTRDLQCKLIDFGTARVKNLTKTTTNAIVGSIPWMAPELLSHEDDSTSPPYSFASDIYSLGLTLWEIVARRTPFSNLKNPGAISLRIATGKLEPIPDDADPVFKRAIESCTKFEASQRIDIQSLLHMFS